QPDDAERPRRDDSQARRASDVLGDGPGQLKDDVDLAFLESGGAGRVIGHHLEHEPFHARRLSPVPLEGLGNQFHPPDAPDDAVGPGADRSLLETLVADLRSEERRVGKEWRYRWAREHDEKKRKEGTSVRQ